MSVMWFNYDDVVDEINKKEPKLNLPINYKNFKPKDKELIEKFLCKNIKFKYVEKETFDASSLKEFYKIEKVFEATCKLMPYLDEV